MRQFKTVLSSDKTKIFYRINRQKRPFLCFVHGLTGNYSGYLEQLTFFEDKGYSTVAFDLRGHGRSGSPSNNDFGVDAMVQDLRAILEKERIGKISLIGHCYGGVVSLAFYKLFPEKIGSLILINSTYKDPLSTNAISFAKYLRAVVEAICDLIMIISRKRGKYKNRDINFSKLRKWPNWLIICASAFLFTDQNTVSSCHRKFLDFDGEEILKKIKVKTLIIAGEKDGFFPLWVARKMKKDIKKSKLEIIEGARHLTIMKRAKEVNQKILKFIENGK